MTPRLFRSEDFSTYSIILGADRKLAGLEKHPESTVPPRHPIPTELDDSVGDLTPGPVAETFSGAAEEAVFERQMTNAEAETMKDTAASSPSLQDFPEDATPAANETAQFEAEITDAEAEMIVEEIAAASPTLQDNAEAAIPSSPPVYEVPLDESLLAARLDCADPVVFKVCSK